jgi:phosphate transport system substrate-binding protein
MIKQILCAALVAALALPVAALADTSLTAAGSTALLPLVKQSADDYQTAHPDVKINVSGGGSFVGITQAQQGNVDLGDSDVIAPAVDHLRDHKVAVVGFGVIVNPSTGVTNLSAKQIRDIFAARVSNWNQVGGVDQPIVVINRPTTSGTRFVFRSTLMGVSQIAQGSQVVDSSGQVVSMVGTTPGAISYVALGYTKNQPVTVLKLDHVAATVDNIRTGHYPVWSYEHIFTSGKSNPASEAFIAYIAGDRDLLEKLGYIAVSTMKVKESGR